MPRKEGEEHEEVFESIERWLRLKSLQLTSKESNAKSDESTEDSDSLEDSLNVESSEFQASGTPSGGSGEQGNASQEPAVRASQFDASGKGSGEVEMKPEVVYAGGHKGTADTSGGGPGGGEFDDLVVDDL